MAYPRQVFLIIICILTGSVHSQDVLQELKLQLLDEKYDELIGLTDTVQVPDSLQDEVYFYRGSAYRSQIRYDSAYGYFSLAAMLDSSNVNYRVSAANMLSRLGRNKDAIKVFERLRRDSLAEGRHLTDLAGLYFLRKQYSESLEIYEELLAADSLNYYYLKQAGKCYHEMDLADSALHCFESAFRINPADPFLTHQIANIYLRKKDLENAMFSLQKGFVYDTANIDLLKLRGYLWLLGGDYQRAVWDLENARSIDSNSVFIHKYLGLSYHEHKKFDEARETLRKAFLLDSTDAETAFFLASSLRWSRHEEEAVEWYKKSIEIQQPDPQDIKDTYLQLAELLKVLHRFDEALDSYDLAIENDPDDNTIYYKIGQLYDRNLGKKKIAIEYYERYLHEGKTDQQLFDAGEGTSTPLGPFVRRRIDKLKEELFFENDQE